MLEMMYANLINEILQKIFKFLTTLSSSSKFQSLGIEEANTTA